jgi:hypothetical protein
MTPSQEIPICKTCGAQAMPNTHECPFHWRFNRGWDEKNACYRDEDLPFEAGAEDTQGWDSTIERVANATSEK